MGKFDFKKYNLVATLGGVGRNPHCPGLDRVGGWGGDDGKGEGVRGGRAG